MSHYTVGVITREKPSEYDIEEALARFDENTSVPHYIRHTKAQIIKDGRKRIEEYKNTTYAEYLADPEKYADECPNEAHLKYLREVFPEKLKWTDEQIFEDFVKDYKTKDEAEEDESYVDEEGNVWSTYNPDSKWDWWEVGGRWSGEIPMKRGAERNEELWDSVRIKDIKWGNDVDVAKYLEKNPDVKKAYEDGIAGKSWYRAEYFKQRYPTIDAYVKEQAAFATYAVLDENGTWNEPGQMGWFGCSSASADDEQAWYNTYYEKFIKGKDDYWFTLVDCHI